MLFAGLVTAAHYAYTLYTDQNSVHSAREVLTGLEVVSVKEDGSAGSPDKVAVAGPEQKSRPRDTINNALVKANHPAVSDTVTTVAAVKYL